MIADPRTPSPADISSRNHASVRAMLAGVNSGRFEEFLERLDEGVIYEAPYYEHFGQRHGRAEIAAMFEAMQERFAALNYDIVAEYRAVDPTLVIVECPGDNVLLGSDRHYRNHYVTFVHFTPDGLVRLWRAGDPRGQSSGRARTR